MKVASQLAKNFLESLRSAVAQVDMPVIEGTVQSVSDTVLDAVLPGATVGALVQIGERGIAQVSRVEQTQCRLVPMILPTPPSAGTSVRMLERVPTVPVGDQTLGRVVSPLGIPMDQQGDIRATERWPIQRSAPHPFDRPAVTRQLVTGLRAIDGLLAMGIGGRMGLFAGPGQGKSTLLGMLAKGATLDVCVICLAGERGREAGEFVRQTLGASGLKNSVVVLATSDASPAERVLAMHSATAIAEWFRDQGKDVLLLVDSLTRVVRARRDIDLALGEPVGPGGLAATTLSFLPALLERAAPNARGTISAVYTVLSQTQGDDVISSEITSLLDGHILLSAKRADAGKWPAIDVVKSVSRTMKSVATDAQLQMAARLRSVLAAYEDNEDLLLMGAYTAGSCPLTDAYLRCREYIDAFLTQGDVAVDVGETHEALQTLTQRLLLPDRSLPLNPVKKPM
ncbi:MAG: FliI/YscN family ATPase [Deltaproteobacteria bacterium]|nr:FliI/YscN family ATPase [Deltaproteobacteria bacterium]